MRSVRLALCLLALAVLAVGTSGTYTTPQPGCVLKHCLAPAFVTPLHYTGATARVTVSLLDKTAKLSFAVTKPEYADIRGVFFDLPGVLNAGLGPANCTVTPSPAILRQIEFNTQKVTSAPDSSLVGCPNHAYDFAAEVGTPGPIEDDIHSLEVTVTCNRVLTNADFANAQFGLSLMSVGESIDDCGGLSRLSCKSDNSPPVECPASCEKTCPTCPTCPTCTPTWKTGEWSSCRSSDGSGCNTGKKKRPVTCQCDGAIVDDSKCTGPKPPTEETCEDKSQCVCEFTYSPWECNAVCGAGTAYRTAQCKCGKYPAAESECGVPVLQKDCTDVSGCLCTWKYSPWGDCNCVNGRCGEGTEQRTATCTADNAAHGATINCDSTKCGAQEPLSQRCTDTSGCTCKFEYSPWTCDTTCGSGTATRTAKCKCSNGAGTFSYYEEDESVCGEPELVKPCADQSGCTCSWRYTNFGTCTAANGCGPGKSTRTATCMTDVEEGETSSPCDPVKCGAKQPLDKDCTDTSKCTCKWEYSPFVCDTQCGCGTATRTATCRCGITGGYSYVESDVTKCGASPILNQPCTEQGGCTCSWKYSPWDNCKSASGCGAGTSTRTATCTTNVVGAPAQPCDPTKCGAKEPLTKNCDDSTKCVCAWKYTPFVCDTKCGAGTARRTAECWCNGAKADASKCNSKPPVLTEPCQSQDECKCSWKYSAFGTCAATGGCGVGSRTRTAMCTPDSTANIPIVCTPEKCGPKAPLTEECVDKSRCTCEWKYGDFSQCSTNCGSGKRTRSATCQCGASCGFSYTDPTGASCKTAPVKEEACSSTTGCKCTWKYHPWSQCSSQCGCGKQFRMVKECSATASDGSTVKCCVKQCGLPDLIQSCTGTSTCSNKCIATPCNGDTTHAKTLVEFTQGPDGTLVGKVEVQQPAFGDLRGVFVEFPNGHKIDSSKCTISGSVVSSFARNCASAAGQSSVNLNGCKNDQWDLIAAFGSEGRSKDDYRSVSFKFACTGYNLTPADVAGAVFGVRITSVGDSASCREDSLKVACVMPSTTTTTKSPFARR